MESPRLRRSPRWLSALALLLSFISVDSVGTKIHEHMTAQELRSVFHVDHPSQVPEYHLVQLTHHLSRRHVGSSHPSNTYPAPNSKIPHEKNHQPKRNKFKSEKSPPSLLNDQMFINARKNIKDVDIFGDLNNTVSVHFGDSNSDDSDSDNSEKVDAIPTIVDADSKIVDADSIIVDADSTIVDAESNIETGADLEDKEHIVNHQEDGTHKITLGAFGKQLELVLRKQEGLLKRDGLKMWNVLKNESQPHGVDYEEMESGDEEELGELFQDEASGAALLIRRDPKREKLVVEGSIGHDLVIRPIPDSMSSAAQDDEMFLDPANMEDMVSIDTGLPIVRRRGGEREQIRRVLSGAGHVIIRRSPSQGDHESDYAFMEPDHMSKRFRRRRSTEEQEGNSRRKREAPYVIYPEILVIVDYDGYRLHGGDNVQIKRYFVSFWNGVDLRYKLLKGPRIRISIAGIIISRGRDATPYLERNRVGRDAIDSAAALTDMGKYLFRERRLPVYDIAVAITKLDMCRRQYANDACNRGTAGFAYVGGACVVNKRLEKVNSVAIIEDTGGFSGIIVAAHEVGHLLGAVHDGSPPPSYLGGPGAEKCRWEDGFIMSDLRHTEKGFRWSPCSVQSFHHFLNGDTATCLYNSPHEDDSLPRVLPGRLLTLDAQCRKDRGTSACFKDERVCAQLFCFDAGSGYCVAYRPAAEGSPCGDGQYCINGRCITENENIIPDYSQHTPSYVRPDTSPFFSANATSVEVTTQPYFSMTSLGNNQNYFQNIDYSSKTPEHNVYSTPAPVVTTANPYNYFYYTQSTTKNPYESNYQMAETKSTSYTLPSSVSTQHPYVYNKYSITSTKSPYDFNDFTTRRYVKTSEHLNVNPYQKQSSYTPYEGTTEKPSSYNPEKTTFKPKTGFFSRTDLDGFFNRTTSKNPYGFSFKGNNVKSLYKIGTFYSQPKNDNVIRPEANSQQVQIEPAGLVYAFQSNVSNVDGNYRVLCTGQDAYLRIECQTPQNAATSK